MEEHFSSVPPNASDLADLRDILLNPTICSHLYPPLRKQATQDEIWSDWTGTQDIAQHWFVRIGDPQAGKIIANIRLQSTELSYFVHPEHWGKGVGGRLLKSALHAVSQSQSTPVCQAYCLLENTRSIRLLESTGFGFFERKVDEKLRRNVLGFRYVFRLARTGKPARA